MYQVIARKYRPQSFEDVVNQNHVKQTLINAVTQQRVGHGYIFSGPRGTGKTTMARILAKALNCQQGPTATPCQQCSSCLEIAAGNSMDLVEIDAASNRRIDDIRELRENVRYRPVRDRYKVFIIDEAHQITTDAFNALLKTLEEPPEWVVFILCTTEPQQFPATIVSRCQSFPFRTVEIEDVVGRMQWICGQEGIEADDDALVAIALSGDGSIRDSLSTLDQAIASFGKKLEAEPVRNLLGAIPAVVSRGILQALKDQDPAALLAIIDRLASEGHHLQHFCGELTRYFRNLLVMRISGSDTRLVAAGPEERKDAAVWLEEFSQEDLTRYLNILLDLYRDLQHSPQPRFRLEIGLLKLVHAGRLRPLEELLAGWNPGTEGKEGPRSQAPTGSGSSASGGAGGSASGAAAGPQGVAMDKPVPAAARVAVAGASGGAGTVSPELSPELPAPATDEAAPRDQSREGRDPHPAPRSPGAEDLRARLAAALREQGDEPLADALDHGRVELSGGSLIVRTFSDYRAVLQLGSGDLANAASGVLGRPARVTLGDDLGEEESAALLSRERLASGNGPPGSAGTPAGESEAANRALGDPEVQKIQRLFTGQIREVRNLRGYTS